VAAEGPYTKAGVFLGAVAIVVGYLVAAGENDWWPFATESSASGSIADQASDRESDTSSPDRPTTTTTVATTTTTTPPDTVYWSGTISLDEYGSVRPELLRDLDTAPPTTDESEGDVGAGDIENASGVYGELVSPQGGTSVAAWSDGSAPTRTQCREAAAAAGSAVVELKPGEYACVRTSHGRTASLQLTKLVADQSLEATVTVWDDGDF
jgi:hypothetical protein